MIREEGIVSINSLPGKLLKTAAGVCQSSQDDVNSGKYRQASFVDVPFKNLDLPSFAKINTIIHTPSEITVHKDAKLKLILKEQTNGAVLLMPHRFRLAEFG